MTSAMFGLRPQGLRHTHSTDGNVISLDAVRPARQREAPTGSIVLEFDPDRAGDRTVSLLANPLGPPGGLLLSVDAAEAVVTIKSEANGSRRGLFASLAVHLGIVSCLIWHPSALLPGGGGSALDTVSVDIITADALESLAKRPLAGAASAGKPMMETNGNPAPQQEDAPNSIAVPELDAAKQTTPLPSPSLIVAKPDEEADAEDVLVASPKRVPARESDRLEATEVEPAPDTPPEAEKEAIEKKELRPRAPPAVANALAQANVSGGATSSGQSNQVTSEASAGASAGALSRYALEVRLALGRSRPKHSGIRGRVVIAFGLTPEGRISFARVERASGNERLDEAALAALRVAIFPPPPPGTTDPQRSYVAPFEFR